MDEKKGEAILPEEPQTEMQLRNRPRASLAAR